MPDAFETCLAFTMRAEGGYVGNPADPGGPTRTGVTWQPCANGPTIRASALPRSRT